MKRALTILITAFYLLPACGQKPSPAVYTLDPAALEKVKGKLNNNDATYKEAFKQLLKDAEKALKFGPVSVMEKTNTPPSGDKHDYMSLAPYFWPDSSKKDGLPYIRKDGQTNPEVKDYKDKDYMPKLCDHVLTLGLAYYFTGDNMYAKHAALLLRTWFIDTATRMNPNLNFGQAIKGVTEGRGAGMIDTRHFVKVVDAIGLISTSKDWKATDQQAMVQWFTDFLTWMQTSKNGTDEMRAKNNHGAWYDAQRLSMALFTGNNTLAAEVIRSAADRLDKQMDANHDFPKELERTISLHYTVFALEAFFDIASMAQKTGVDFWNMKTANGKSLRAAFERVHPFLTGEQTWEGPQIKPFDSEEAYPILAAGAVHFGCKQCPGEIRRLAGDKAARLRINLLY